jgi:hypothetical protein
MEKIRSQYGEQAYPSSRIEEAKQLFDSLLDTSFANFSRFPLMTIC